MRNVPPDLAKALEAEKRHRGRSLNQTVIELLRDALGLGRARRRTNGLERFAGTWSGKDLTDFEAATAPFEQIDEELWR